MGLKIEAFDVPRASRDAAHHAHGHGTTGRLAVAARGGSVSSILAISKSDGVPTEVAVPLAITYQTLLGAPDV
jgi:hypothetical protein